jgi:hypothetical protein
MALAPDDLEAAAFLALGENSHYGKRFGPLSAFLRLPASTHIRNHLRPSPTPHTPPSPSGKIAPEYEGLELNVGGATVSAALCEVTGAKRGAMRGLYGQHGDLGDVALVSWVVLGARSREKWLCFRALFC